jgi:hypothetical protein
MSRLSQQQQDRTYIELHVAELQRMVHRDTHTTAIDFSQRSLPGEHGPEAEVVLAVMRTVAALSRTGERVAAFGSHRLEDGLSDALSRILDLAERCNIDLGVALANRLLGGSVDSGRHAP